jgi:hypothetical protein
LSINRPTPLPFLTRAEMELAKKAKEEDPESTILARTFVQLQTRYQEKEAKSGAAAKELTDIEKRREDIEQRIKDKEKSMLMADMGGPSVEEMEEERILERQRREKDIKERLKQEQMLAEAEAVRTDALRRDRELSKKAEKQAMAGFE